jgi:hypothetical protein
MDHIAPTVESYHRAPFAPVFMARALLASHGQRLGANFPPLLLRWSDLRIAPQHWAAFCTATGTREGEPVPVLYPHVLGFRLQMALLTHPAFPLPIWRALQIRNHLVRHTHIEHADSYELETRIAGHRRVAKGLEVDLSSRLVRGPVCAWESRVTYFYRGYRGDVSADAAAAPPPPPDLSAAPIVARWRMPGRGGWRFGALTGDYNGIHWSRWYARRFGFHAAFLHPQRVAGMCVARLQEPASEAQTLDLWLRGPVAYGASVELAAGLDRDALQFALSLAGDRRGALIGSWAPRPVGGDALAGPPAAAQR